ncbi:MAG: rhodanese-like domain-containing protein [Clostridiales bacterium]|nr:rhodanese-like domain-containing protein [Clostridiales bacterium]
MRPKVKHINWHELIDLLESGEASYQYVDVRTPKEYDAGKLKEFINIPLQVLDRDMEDLDKGKPVVLICESGSRSISAARMLSKAEFSSILNVRGGISILDKRYL